MTDIQYNTAETLLANVRADTDALMGGPSAEYATSGSSSGGNDDMIDLLEDLSKLLKKLIDKLGDDDSGSSGGSGWSGGSSDDDTVIAGTGRIWGDPHFIGQDGGKYDVQGEAGKSYNLLSDKDFQMNGRFDQYKNTDGLTVVGQVGIAAGSDQIEVNKTGEVLVNGQELKAGDKVQLEDGGYVEYHANGGGVTVESGEWKTDIDFQNKGSGPTAHLNIDVSTDNAVADGVKPHGLLGQTFDADDDARNGDKGKGTQGGGAIEDANGNITDRGDREAIELYEVDNVHDRNFTEFNQFFDDYEANPGGYNEEVMQIISNALSIISDIMDDFSLSTS
ncbi:MAG: VWD domain-containing protein [Pseudomonadota bacterium]